MQNQGKIEPQSNHDLPISPISSGAQSNGLFEMSTDIGMILQLADGSFQACNARAEELLGLTAQQMQSCTSLSNLWQTVHEDGSPFPGEMHPATVALQTGQPYSNVVMGFCQPNGEFVWLMLKAQPLFQANQSAPYAVITTFTQIAQPSVAPYRSEQSPSQQLLATLESISDAFFSLDHDWRFTYLNSQATQLLNRRSEDLIGKKLWETFPEAVGTLFEQEYRRAVAEQITVSFESFYPPFNAWYAVRAYPIASGLAVYFQNVTQQKIAQAAFLLQEQTAQQRLAEIEAIYATAPIGLCFVDSELRFVRINDRLAEINGIPAADHIGKTLREMLPEMADDLEPLYHQVIQTGVPIEQHEVHGTNSAQPGVERDWLLSLYPLKADDGQVLGINVTVDEITQRKQAEEALRRSEERYRSLFESIDEGFCIIEMLFDENDTPIDYRFLEINSAFEQHTGLEQARGKTARHLLPNLEEHWFEIYGNIALTGEPYRFEQGSEAMNRWFDVFAFRFGQPENRKVAIRFKDISERVRVENERQQAEAALRDSEQRLQAIIDNSKAAIFMKDVQGHYLLMNRECEQLFHVTNDWVQGKTDYDLFPTEIADALRINDQQVIDSGTALTLEEEIPLEDGIHTYIAVKFSLVDDTGVPYAICGISTDISERVRLEAERDQVLKSEQAARAEAEQANRIKDEFLAVLSHELRSPLNPILGWTKLLQTGRLDSARSTEALATIERNAKLQSQLIEDLLDISRIMRGKLALNCEPTSLALVISAAAETVRLAAEAKQIQLEMSFDPNVGLIFGDAGRLQQVVWNLLSNAVKFTPENGRVDVQLIQVGHLAQIQVIDTGKGIHPEFVPFMFEYFRQEDGSTTRKFGGLGLGLAIARQIVEMHGGTISADSAGEGQGATFTVRLPLLQPVNSNPTLPVSPAASSLDDLTPLVGIRVLVVDDDADTREFLTFLLELSGAIVATVDSAAKALQAIEQSPPNILLSDIGMPDMDGYTLMRTIRACEQNRSIPAIALTAYAGDLDRQQALQVGFQHHVTKPIDPDAVVAIVLELVQHQP